jgi:hypothetical protein
VKLAPALQSAEKVGEIVPALQIAEKLDFVLAFGWRSGSPLR